MKREFYFCVLLSCLLIALLGGCGKKTGGGAATNSPFGDLDHPNWTHQIIDSQTGTGRGTSIAVDSKGMPHISYLNLSKHELKYATLGGKGWLITTVDSENQRGTSSSLAIDSQDQPHIIYIAFNPTWNRICPYTAHKQSEEWTFKERDSMNMESEDNYTSIVIGDSDYCHFAYYYDSINCLYYGYDYASGSSTILFNDFNVGGKFAVLALDTNNKPHISFYGNGLKHYYRDAGGYKRNEDVVDDPNAGYYSSFALDQNDAPHFAYVDLSTGELKYVKKVESAWAIEVIDDPGTHDGQRTCLAVDSDNRPHISYYDANKKSLKYTWHDGTKWVIVEEAPSAGGDIGQYAALALDSSGNAHISHYDAVNQNLLYSKFAH